MKLEWDELENDVALGLAITLALTTELDRLSDPSLSSASHNQTNKTFFWPVQGHDMTIMQCLTNSVHIFLQLVCVALSM